MTKLESERLAHRIRTTSLEMVARSQSSHIGSSLSISDLVAVLYSSVMTFDPALPSMPSRDRFILSKGHACAAVYAALAYVGYFPPERLKGFGTDGSDFMTHISHKVLGVEFSSGSLGHGLPYAAGKALAIRNSGNATSRVFVLVGDGELDEGSNWEAILFAAHQGLRNLVLIVDCNNLQSLTTVDATLGLEPLDEKFRAFGWLVDRVDGHNHGEIKSALESIGNAPRAILARTVKGKGVSFMEHSVQWHYRSPNEEELACAIEELRRQLEE